MIQHVEIGQIISMVSAEPNTWVQERRDPKGPWFPVAGYSVYIYACMGGGYDSIVNVVTEANVEIRIENAVLATARPAKEQN